MTSRRSPNRGTFAWALFRLFVVVILLFVVASPVYDVAADAVSHLTSDGPESLANGKKLFEEGDYEKVQVPQKIAAT